jgi:uncharacterized membrane protein
MVYLNSKNPYVGIFLECLGMKMFGTFYSLYIGPFGVCIFWPFGIFLVICFIFSHFGTFDQEKSGNTDGDRNRRPILKKIVVAYL